MMRTAATVALATSLLVALSPSAEAGAEASLYLGRSYAAGLALADVTTFGGSVGAFSGPVGFELGVEYSPLLDLRAGPVGLEASMTNVMGNLVFQIPLGRVVPYATAGYGAFVGRAGIDPLPLGLTGTFGALNYGGGARVFLSERIGLRVDVRRFSVRTPADAAVRVPLLGLELDASPELGRVVAGLAFRF